MIVSEFNGKVPRTMEEMLHLPGVARKTANIVLANAYGVVAGIPVDTHVKRLSQRLGLASGNNPDKIEHELLKLMPAGDCKQFPYLLIEHGRKICLARRPHCAQCALSSLCDYFKSLQQTRK